MLHLSPRLQTICDMVEEGSRVCDVGCDHAYVDIRLLQEGKIPSALAMDVAEGPLSKAQANLELTELAGRCELRLSDGLGAYRPGEADVMICTGMGGLRMRSILEAHPEKTVSFRELILSPHREMAPVRGWLSDNGCTIVDEIFLEDDGKYYTVIKAVPPVAEDFPYSSLPAGAVTNMPAENAFHTAENTFHIGMRMPEESAVPGAAAVGVTGKGPEDTAAGAAGPRPDWEGAVRLVRGMSDEAIRAAMIERGQTLRLLTDTGFRRYTENLYGPCVLAKFLRGDSASDGARTAADRTQSTFCRFLIGALREKIHLAESLAAISDSDGRDRAVGGEGNDTERDSAGVRPAPAGDQENGNGGTAVRLRQLRGEIGIMQVLLFLYSVRDRL